MKKIVISIVVFVAIATMTSRAQEAQEQPEREKFGNTLNMGVGIGYYGYLGRTLPVGMLSYEFDVAKNFTLAPFAGFYSYRSRYYWGYPYAAKDDPSYRWYSYHATAIPVGVKGMYYFDQLLHATSDWDFYAGASFGFVFRSVVWDSNYYGDRYIYQDATPLYLDAHVGAEYHLNQKLGLFLDLSSGLSTIGMAMHFNK